MKVVWLGWEDIYSTRRVKEAARALGVDLDSYEIHDISLSVEGKRVAVLGKGVDLLETYDGLVVRTFYPYISEALTSPVCFAMPARWSWITA